MGQNKFSCGIPCGPGDWKRGGKCDLNGCYHESERCVHCNALLDNPTTDLVETGQDELPRPGNFTICFSCGQPYVYVENLQDPETPLRKPITKNEFRAMPLVMQKVIRDAWDFRKRILEYISEQMKGSGDL